MKLTQEETKKVLGFIRKEPRTVQEVSRLIKRSWITADSYLQKIKEETGLIDIKVFRKGTRGALKIAYYPSPDSLSHDELHAALLQQIQLGKRKHDFDFMELFQFVPDGKKRAFVKAYGKKDELSTPFISNCLKSAEHSVHIFSGNLSFLSENDAVLAGIEQLLMRKIRIRILIRINMASLSNISRLYPLLKKYSELIEIRHRYHPLRGVVVDGKAAVFRAEEQKGSYRESELGRSAVIFYEIYDSEWVEFLQKVFWSLFRSSISMAARVKELEKIK